MKYIKRIDEMADSIGFGSSSDIIDAVNDTIDPSWDSIEVDEENDSLIISVTQDSNLHGVSDSTINLYFKNDLNDSEYSDLFISADLVKWEFDGADLNYTTQRPHFDFDDDSEYDEDEDPLDVANDLDIDEDRYDVTAVWGGPAPSNIDDIIGILNSYVNLSPSVYIPSKKVVPDYSEIWVDPQSLVKDSNK